MTETALTILTPSPIQIKIEETTPASIEINTPAPIEVKISTVGMQGPPGPSIPGEQGEVGKTAYQVAVDNGFVGTEEEWLLSLKGDPGQDGEDGQDGQDGVPLVATQEEVDAGIDNEKSVTPLTLKNYPGFATPEYVDSKINKATEEVDFGAVGDFVQKTVTASWIKSTSVLSIKILPNLADHSDEDSLLEQMECTYGNIIEDTSFDVFVHAPNDTHGRYLLKIIGV